MPSICFPFLNSAPAPGSLLYCTTGYRVQYQYCTVVYSTVPGYPVQYSTVNGSIFKIVWLSR